MENLLSNHKEGIAENFNVFNFELITVNASGGIHGND